MVGVSKCFNAMQFPNQGGNDIQKIDICKAFNTMCWGFTLKVM